MSARLRKTPVRMLLVALLLGPCLSACMGSGRLSSYRTLFETDWSAGLSPRIGIQAPALDDIVVMPDPASNPRKVVRVSVSRQEDFTRVASGTPRAELVFSPVAAFSPGHDYLIRWSTYLPAGFGLDPLQMAIITQIHHGMASGSPPIMLTLAGAQYTFSERGGAHTEHGQGVTLCCASKDEGRWVTWALQYVPDATGQHASTRLWKDDLLVYSSSGVPNAYANDDNAYLKMGLYKPDWKVAPTSVSRITLFFGPVYIGVSE